ncbi:hypothetical protein CWI36_0413p0010 [Hamiltosporidium magnivora]|uniref:Nucleoporin Nup54 alpha-helical domain-containing protein n=1 Tax=Hamiltosporidium magnivora TaxID=148818 RepID=A0A4Q9LG07_9MICR|nr:hypothetical protein CWI36_0413p0010 [Hamiltosporidium magnivora]
MEKTTIYQKEKEILQQIESLESSYNEMSPLYKFKYIFYNIVSQPIETCPIDFPVHLWERAIRNAPALNTVPVVVKGYNGLEERRKRQIDVTTKIKESLESLCLRTGKLKMRTENITCRLKNAGDSYKKLFSKIYCNIRQNNTTGLTGELFRLKGYINEIGIRKANSINKDYKEQVINTLGSFKNLGVKMLQDLENDLKVLESKKNNLI